MSPLTSLSIPSPAMLHDRLRPEIRALQPQLVQWRRHLHQRPELGFQEQLTSDFIAKKTQGVGH